MGNIQWDDSYVEQADAGRANCPSAKHYPAKAFLASTTVLLSILVLALHLA
jgi:hypothetical protein